MLLNCLKTSFQLTNKYIILATPLILFALLSSLYILFSLRGNLINIVITLILFVFMLTAFLAGWAYMLKLCVSQSYKEEPNTLIKEFPAGVGEYFLPTLGLLFNVLILSVVFYSAVYFIGMKFIGEIGISAETLSNAFNSTEALKEFLMSLSKEQLIKLNLWNFLLLLAMGIEYFLLMFHLPALMFKTANPFKAFFISLKNLFSRAFFKNILLYLMLFISYSILSVLTTILGINIFMHFVFTLINFYYVVYVAILVFNYYYENFIKIGGKFNETV